MKAFLLFCKHHIALLHALFFLLGLGFIKDFNGYFLFLFLVIFLSVGWKTPRKLLPFLAIFILACIYGNLKKESFPKEKKFVQGQALFIPSEIKSYHSHFKKIELLKGSIHSMKTPSNEVIKNIPCTISLSSSVQRAPMNSSYYIYGSLEKKGEFNHSFFSFKADLSTPWIALPHSFSLTEWRFQTKQFLFKKIHLIFSNSKVADFITALTLGTLEDRMLKFEFSRLGLQHILAISGFHFGLLALLLGIFFRIFFKDKIAYLILLLSLTAYFILLGNSPSILRAYLALSLYLISKLGNWHANGLNILGATLFLELLIDPHVISHLGFQLSFLATFSILFLLPLVRKAMLLFFPYRTLIEVKEFNVLEKWTYLFCCFLRSAFALNIAVSLSMIPVCLFHFHKFPLISLAYNLFIPPSFSLSLFLFFISIPFFFLCPPIASLLTYCNEWFTSQVLELISQSPVCFDLSLRVPKFPLPLLLALLLTIFSLPFLCFKKKHISQNYNI